MLVKDLLEKLLQPLNPLKHLKYQKLRDLDIYLKLVKKFIILSLEFQYNA